MRILQSCSDFEDASEDDLRVIGRWVLFTAVEPFRKTAPDEGRRGSPRLLNGAFNLFFQSLAFAAPEPKEGRPIAELVKQLDIGPDTSKTSKGV